MVECLVVLPYNSKDFVWDIGIGLRTMIISSLKVKDGVLALCDICVDYTYLIP